MAEIGERVIIEKINNNAENGEYYDKKIVLIKNSMYERTEDYQKYYFRDISNRKIKVNFTITKDIGKQKEAEKGLTSFWAEVL